VAVPAPGAPVEPGTGAAEVAPARPASLMEAIIVSSEDEAEAGNATPRAASPMVSDLLHAIPDSSKVALNLGAGRAEEVSSSGLPGRIVGGSLLGDEIIIEPPLSGGSRDLVHATPDPSIWGGPTLAWMSTEGDPYFVLDDLEECEFWDELRAVTHIRVLLPFVVGIICPLAA
jgi:hypothetical protein